jgi:hypothetical protein
MPEINIAPLREDINNADILNAIRRNASTDYQRRIPETTKNNIQDNLQNLTAYRPAWNEFVDALINQIGLVIVKNNIWTNPLAKFKRGMLNFGETIEEINVGLIEARSYQTDRDSLERDLFGTHAIDVQSSFHKINRMDMYPVTVNENLLQRAFLESGGLSTFVSAIMSAPTTSDNWDEFLLTTSLLKEYYNAGGFFKSNVPDVGAAGSDAADAKYFLRRTREFAGNLSYISTHYNASGMPVAANPEELELFITPEALASIDVEALAGAFNIDKAAMPEHTTIIPSEHFGIPGAQAVLTTRDFFVIADNRIEMASQYNPAKLQSNFFLHHWETVSASRFVPAILFTTEEGSVITLVDTPVTSVSAIVVADADGTTVTDVARGTIYQVGGSAVTTPGGGVNDAVKLSLTGALSQRTYVTQAGVLHIAPDEDATLITVVGTATDNNAVSSSVSVNVVGAKLDLWPNPSVSADVDADGIFETGVPVAPTFVDNGATGVVTIPAYTQAANHYVYKKAGVNIAAGDTTISASTVFTVVALSGWELPAGAVASWTFAP